MKRALNFAGVLMTLVWAVLASGCAADDEFDNVGNPENGSKKQITITVGASSGANTRVDYDGGTLLKWHKDDQILVVGFNGSEFKGKETFTLTSIDGIKNATFTGNMIEGANNYAIDRKSVV